MSRVGKRILEIPNGVTVSINNNNVVVKGSLGEISKQFPTEIKISVKDNKVLTTRNSEEKFIKQLHGTINSLIEGMIIGVSNGFKKEIEIKGVGYKANLQGDKIEIFAGYSHPHYIEIPKDIKVEIPKPTEIIVSGVDKQKVGQLAANIRDIRRPNPYSGKGIMYKGEHIRRKEGKAATK